MRENTVPIELNRELYPHSYQFNFVTIRLKSGKTVKAEKAFWTPSDDDGEFLVVKNETENSSSYRRSIKRDVYPINGTVVLVEDENAKFIFETCEKYGFDHVCGDDIAFHLSPISHATLYSKSGHQLIAENVCVGGWHESKSDRNILAYFTENCEHDDKEWISSATRVPIDTLVFAPSKEIHWEASNLVWP